jgi:anaerobic magnesium-protoporphyrin IX monomethyl ester cyclase
MTKVLLVNPDFKETRADDSIFPFGYAAMGAVLQKHGHEVDYIFPSAHRISLDEAVELASRSDAQLLGIGGLFPYLPAIKKFIAALKARRPDLPVIAGGPMITHAPEFGFQESGADLACNGEGEVLLLKVADAMRDGAELHSIPGIVYRSESQEVVINGTGELMPFEDIPMPTWSDFPMEYYLYTDWFIPEYAKTERKRTFAWHLSRGCPSKCNFCVSGCATRQKSVELCMSELESIVDRFRPDRMIFVDDFLLSKRTFIDNFCEELIKRDFGFEFSATSKFYSVAPRTLQLLKRAGCSMIFYGLEVANDRILRLMKKGIKVDMARRVIEETKAAGIHPMVSMMMGQPTQEISDFTESLKYALAAINPADPAPNAGSVTYLMTYPGTGIYRHALEEGIIRDDADYWERFGSDYRISYTSHSNWTVGRLVDTANLIKEWKYYQSRSDMLRRRWEDYAQESTPSDSAHNDSDLQDYYLACRDRHFNGRLVDVNYRGCSIYLHGDSFVAIAKNQPELDIERLRSGGYSMHFAAERLRDVRAAIDEYLEIQGQVNDLLRSIGEGRHEGVLQRAIALLAPCDALHESIRMALDEAHGGRDLLLLATLSFWSRGDNDRAVDLALLLNESDSQSVECVLLAAHLLQQANQTEGAVKLLRQLSAPRADHSNGIRPSAVK